MTEIGRSDAAHDVVLPSGGSVRLSWAAATDIGHRRQVNEDSVISRPPVFAVADGMGGHSAGDLASTAVVTRLADSLPQGFVTPGAIGLALAQAAHDIGSIEGTSLLGAGTTVTGVALTLSGEDPYFAVFNVGDSRVYALAGDSFEQVTVDHSVVQELVDAGAITRAQAEHHPDSNVITRAIGFNEPPMPDYWMLPIQAGLRLLVCSDGLTKEVDDATLELALTARASADDTASALVEAALTAGGRDNVTVIVLDVVEVVEGPESAAEERVEAPTERPVEERGEE